MLKSVEEFEALGAIKVLQTVRDVTDAMFRTISKCAHPRCLPQGFSAGFERPWMSMVPPLETAHVEREDRVAVIRPPAAEHAVATSAALGPVVLEGELDRVLDVPTVYSWGSSRNYALGHRDGASKNRPTVLPTFAPPVGDGSSAVEALAKTTQHISTSSYHTLFLTGAGLVLSCGFGRGHRLGTGDESTRLEPAVVDSLKHVKCVDIAVNVELRLTVPIHTQ